MRASVDVAGLEIAYERAGEGPPLVLLHGAMADGRTWRPQLDGLSDRLTVIAWDEPGAGGSADPSADFGLPDYADALAGLIGALGFDAAHVGGLSWGGVVALELYRRDPDRVISLILADTYAGWKGSLPEAECAQRLAHAFEQSELPPGRFEPTLPGLLKPGAPQAVADTLAAIMAEARPESMRRTAVAIATCDQRDLLARIAVPTLLIWGEDDLRSPLSVAEQFHAAIPGARLVLIPEAGHMTNLEQPALFNDAVRDFCPRVQRWR
jgi:pimeloyl-ACP methyl ester carboxylesterase